MGYPRYRGPSKRKRWALKAPETSPGDATFKPDVEPPPVTKARCQDLECRRCVAKPKDSEWALLDDDGQPVGEACLRCWRPFQAEYQRDGTWEEVCDKCEEEVYNNGYEKAANIMAKEQPIGHDPNEVFAEDDYELETVRSFVAIPRGSYSTAVDGGNPIGPWFHRERLP